MIQLEEKTGNSMDFKKLREYNIKDLVGAKIYVTFLASDVIVKKQKDDKKFIALQMCDLNMKYPAKIFSASEKLINAVKSGKVFDATVELKNYRNDVSAIIQDIRESNLSYVDFSPWAANIPEYSEKLSKMFEYLKDTNYRPIVTQLLQERWEKFNYWAAAKGQHHSEVVGLLAHTVSVTENSLLIANKYNKEYGENFINKPLLIAGALLHDIGKIDELEVDLTNGEVKYSINSSLSTHIMNALTYISEYAILNNIRDIEEVILLKHIIAAHHGKLEWGSPITASIPEAYILHIADLMDAELYKFHNNLSNTEKGNFTAIWNIDKYNRYYKDNTK